MFYVSKVLRIISILVFLGSLVLAYAYIPLTLDPNIEGIGRIAKGHFFYGFLGVFVVLGAIFYFLIYYVDSRQKQTSIRLAIHLLPFFINLSIALLIGSIGFNNNTQGIDSGLYSYLNYLAAALPVIWIIGFSYALIRKS